MGKNSEIEGPFITEAATKVVRIFRGRKMLTLEINPFYGTAQTFLENCPDLVRETGETTKTYEIARRIMVEESQKVPSGRIDYTLETGYPRMKAWVQDKGREIFNWDSIEQSIDDPEKIKAHATIYAGEKN
jgi:hypothetical protein